MSIPKRSTILRRGFQKPDKPSMRAHGVQAMAYFHLQDTFQCAVQAINQAVKSNSKHLVKNFEDAIQPYLNARAELDMYSDVGYQILPEIDGLEIRWYTITSVDFFNALESGTKEELLKQGLTL